MMQIHLSASDREMLSGLRGPALRMAMSIIVRMAGVYGAKELIDITNAHIDSTIYMGRATLDFAEHLAGNGAQVAVPTTLNVGGIDEHHWHEWPVPQDYAILAQRQMEAYRKMGAVPTWTCAPYQSVEQPAFGEQIAWAESNAIVYANSVIGARTSRYPDLLDVCAAITGRVPYAGLHVTENRAGQVLFRLEEILPELQAADEFYPVLGALIGEISGRRIPVIAGLQAQPTDDQLKSLGAGAASAGRVALFHILGVTPEAPNLDAAFQGRQPEQVVPIRIADLDRARRWLTTANGESLDMVVLGSPHFSLPEFKRLVDLIDGRRKDPSIQFLVTSSRVVVDLANRAGLLEAFQRFGGRVTVDTCPLTSPMLPENVVSLMTNSAKYAWYSPGLLGTKVTFASLSDCVESAVAGRVIRDESLWRSA